MLFQACETSPLGHGLSEMQLKRPGWATAGQDCQELCGCWGCPSPHLVVPLCCCFPCLKLMVTSKPEDPVPRTVWLPGKERYLGPLRGSPLAPSPWCGPAPTTGPKVLLLSPSAFSLDSHIPQGPRLFSPSQHPIVPRQKGLIAAVDDEADYFRCCSPPYSYPGTGPPRRLTGCRLLRVLPGSRTCSSQEQPGEVS